MAPINLGSNKACQRLYGSCGKPCVKRKERKETSGDDGALGRKGGKVNLIARVTLQTRLRRLASHGVHILGDSSCHMIRVTGNIDLSI